MKFVVPVTPIWVLLLPETVHMFSKGRLLAKKVFARSMKVFGWQLGTANFRDHEFPKKKRPGCLEFTGLVTTVWVISLPETMHMVFTERFLTWAVFVRSKKVLRLQLGATKSRKHDLTKKRSCFFDIHWTSDTHMGIIAP